MDITTSTDASTLGANSDTDMSADNSMATTPLGSYLPPYLPSFSSEFIEVVRWNICGAQT
jgi:hypothetical protein